MVIVLVGAQAGVALRVGGAGGALGLALFAVSVILFIECVFAVYDALGRLEQFVQRCLVAGEAVDVGCDAGCAIGGALFAHVVLRIIAVAAFKHALSGRHSLLEVVQALAARAVRTRASIALKASYAALEALSVSSDVEA